MFSCFLLMIITEMYLFGFHYLFSSILIYLDESVKPILNVESDIFIIRDALTLKLRFPH